MKPTDEQVKEFWHKLSVLPYYEVQPPHPMAGVLKPIDLNNLFKYAVPPLPVKYRHPILEKWVLQLTDNYEEDALALFWAIYKVIK